MAKAVANSVAKAVANALVKALVKALAPTDSNLRPLKDLVTSLLKGL